MVNQKRTTHIRFTAVVITTRRGVYQTETRLPNINAPNGTPGADDTCTYIGTHVGAERATRRDKTQDTTRCDKVQQGTTRYDQALQRLTVTTLRTSQRRLSRDAMAPIGMLSGVCLIVVGLSLDAFSGVGADSELPQELFGFDEDMSTTPDPLNKPGDYMGPELKLKDVIVGLLSKQQY